MHTADAKRRLIWHGVLLFFLGLVEGMFVQSMRNPRLGLSARAPSFAGSAAGSAAGDARKQLTAGGPPALPELSRKTGIAPLELAI